MSSRSFSWRRLGVSAVALATVAATLPVLLASPAQAATTARLVLTPGNQTVAAGTCALFTITPVDSEGRQASDTPTVLIRVTEDPESDTQDVDFCEIPGVTTTPVGDDLPGTAFYFNGVVNDEPGAQNPFRPGQARFQEEYRLGTGITPDINGNDPGGNPDVADNTDDQPNDPFFADTNTNPNGQDFAQFRVPSGGQIKFGLVGLRAGTPGAQILAYVERNSISESFPPTKSAEENDPIPAEGVLTFTNGGIAGSQQAADAVTTLDAEPESDVGVIGTAQFFTATLRNNTGQTVAGVSPQVRVISGPNVATGDQIRADCGRSDNNGVATCAFQGRNTGTDTLVVFVNRTSGTAGPDGGEAQDTITRTTTAQANQNPAAARRVELLPDAKTTEAGRSATFTAVITDATGTPVQGVPVTFTETGPGTFTGAGSTATRTTDETGRADIGVTTFEGIPGTQTITATIDAASTDCELPSGTPEGAPEGRCSDSSTHTITASGASPTPSASPTGSPSATPTATISPSPSGQTEAGSRYRGLSSPVRVLDTRDNRGNRRAGEIVLDLSGRITDPNATSAVLNVTVTNATARGFLVAYPTGTAKPGTSNVNFETNQTQANEVVARLSADDKVSLFVDSASAHVIVDLVGSFTESTGAGVGEVTTNAPVRAFDSRNTAERTRRGEVIVDLTGRVPNGSTDAILNVTVTNTSARGFVTAFPTGTNRPGTSNVNFEARQTQANEVITRLGTGSNANKVSLFIDSASASLIVDVVGAVSSTTDGQTFTALASPQRALDTRDNRGARRSGNITVTLPGSVPANATGAILNVTATNGTRPGFVTVFPGGSTNPGTSNVNFPTNLTQANEVTTGLGNNNTVTLFVGGANTPAAHVIVDVVGYLTD